jgi:hypothetical protein
MPEVVVGHPFVLNLDSRLKTAGMTDFNAYFQVNDKPVLKEPMTIL